MQLAEVLTQRGFDADAPLNFIVHLSPLPEFTPLYEYPEELIQQAGGTEILEQFRLALKDLAEQTSFFSFFEQHRSALEQTLQKALQGSDIPSTLNGVEQLYGMKHEASHIVFAPAMFRGGYGAGIPSQNKKIFYAVICDQGRSEQSPEFPTDAAFTSMLIFLSSCIFTEPSIKPQHELLQELRINELYQPVQDALPGSVVEFLTKTIVSSVVTIMKENLAGNKPPSQEQFFKSLIQGYYLNRFTIEQLQNYQAHRDQFPTFNDFLPALLQQYAEHKQALLEMVQYDASPEQQTEKFPLQQTDHPVVLQLADRVSAEILPRIEFLSGVLSQTSWIQKRGPNGKGNTYFQALQAFFAPYRNHDAIQFAEALTQRGFTYDAPPAFMINLSSLPDLAPVYRYPNGDVIKRANGTHSLEFFRKSLKDLAEQSQFLLFFDQHRAEYEQIVREAVQGFDPVPIVAWLETFYGRRADGYHLVLAPAMFPSGGYGPALDTAQTFQVYYIVRESGRNERQPEFVKGQFSFATLVVHEFSHSFVNPPLYRNDDLIDPLDLITFFKPVEERMRRQAYGTVFHFLSETFVRSATALAIRDIFQNDMLFNDTIREDERSGFYLNRFTIQQLQYYQEHRDQYPRFDDFIPYLLQQYAEHKAELLK